MKITTSKSAQLKVGETVKITGLIDVNVNGTYKIVSDVEDGYVLDLVKPNKFLKFVKYAALFAVTFTLILFLIVTWNCDVPYVDHCKGWL